MFASCLAVALGVEWSVDVAIFRRQGSNPLHEVGTTSISAPTERRDLTFCPKDDG
jgi:hypothetical protein